MCDLPSFYYLGRLLGSEWVVEIGEIGAQMMYAYFSSISGLVVEYIVAIDVTRVRFPADACVVAVRWSRLC